MRAIGGDRDRRPADAQSSRRVRLPKPIDEDRPGDLALAPGQVAKQLAEERRQAVKELVRFRITGRGGNGLAAGRGNREPLAGRDERRATPLRRWAFARVNRTPDDHPAHRPAFRMERGPEDGPKRVSRRGEEALQLIALGELEPGEPIGRGVRLGQVRGKRPQPRRRRRRVATRGDHIPEEHEPLHA